jgi:hypothetical protein
MRLDPWIWQHESHEGYLDKNSFSALVAQDRGELEEKTETVIDSPSQDEV